MLTAEGGNTRVTYAGYRSYTHRISSMRSARGGLAAGNAFLGCGVCGDGERVVQEVGGVIQEGWAC